MRVTARTDGDAKSPVALKSQYTQLYSICIIPHIEKQWSTPTCNPNSRSAVPRPVLHVYTRPSASDPSPPALRRGPLVRSQADQRTYHVRPRVVRLPGVGEA